MNIRSIALAALAVAATLSAGVAQARGPVDVQWQVSIGAPWGGYPVQGGVVVSSPAYQPAPVYYSAPQYQPAPVYYSAPKYLPAPVYLPERVRVVPRYGRDYGQPVRWDVDGDGIPNRYDRVYNPRWDRDGDGIPNRYDRDGRNSHGHRDWRDERRGHDSHGGYGSHRDGR